MHSPGTPPPRESLRFTAELRGSNPNADLRSGFGREIKIALILVSLEAQDPCHLVILLLSIGTLLFYYDAIYSGITEEPEGHEGGTQRM